MKSRNDMPNRRTVETLLKELDREYCAYYGGDSELQELNRQKDAMKERLLYKNKKYIALKKKIDTLEFKLSDRRRRNTALVQDVRHLYQRRGITPQVIAGLDALVAKLKRS